MCIQRARTRKQGEGKKRVASHASDDKLTAGGSALKLRQNIKRSLRSITAPPHPQPAPCWAANIDILLTLRDSVRDLDGDVAECGVYRDSTLIYGFDPLQGLGGEVKIDLALGFASVHLNCDMYASYMQCLTYFYPRLPEIVRDNHIKRVKG